MTHPPTYLNFQLVVRKKFGNRVVDERRRHFLVGNLDFPDVHDFEELWVIELDISEQW